MNHAQEAIEWLEDAPVDHHNGDIDRANLGVAMAQAHATLALVEQQRISNLISYFTQIDDTSTAPPVLHEIAEALGLGDPK